MGGCLQPQPSWVVSPWVVWLQRWHPSACRTAGLDSLSSQEPWGWSGHPSSGETKGHACHCMQVSISQSPWLRKQHAELLDGELAS